MAVEDAVLSQLIYSIVIPIILLSTSLLVIYRYGRSLADYIFAYFYSNYIMKDMMKLLAPSKDDLFAELLKLSKDTPLSILEIGSGPGANFAYFPKNSRLVCYDPNPYFRVALFNQAEKFPHVKLETFVVSGAEKLIRTEDESVDAVVSTCVLCTVGDIDEVLKEIRRVLVPGGKFYFLEHTISPLGTFTRRLQVLCNSVWKTVFLGCQLSRDMAFFIKTAGFSDVQLKQFTFPNTGHFFRIFVKEAVVGTAQK